MFKIVTLADRKYFQLVKTMIKSASVNFPEASVYIELVNMGKDGVEEIKKIQPNSVVSKVVIPFANKVQRRGYCGNRIASLLQELRAKSNDILIWVDADMLFRKSCKEFVKIISSCDLAANRRPEGKMIRTALLSFNNTKVATRLINKYAEELEKINKWKNLNGSSKQQTKAWKIWMADTTVFTEIYDNLFKDKLSFTNLPTIYCDYLLSEGGVIWNGLSKNRRKKIWLEETKKW